jgi:PAS domain S-box-containing protein
MDHLHVTGDYMAHGFCFSWEPGLVWLHVVSDVITGISYYAIALALFYVIYKRRDLPFQWIFFLFAIFILSCGSTHFFAAYTVFDPAYWPEGYVKAFTALISFVSAVFFIPLLPKIVALPSLSIALQDNEELNRRLQRKVEELQASTAHLEMANYELQLSEGRFRTIFDSTREAIFILEMQSAKIVDVNRTACDMYGYSREEIVKLGIEDLSSAVPPYNHAAAVELFRKVVAGEPQTFEWQAKKNGGRLFWVETDMKVADIGGFERVLASASDITERKTMADSLRQAKEFTDKVIDSANVLIVGLSINGEVTLLNRTAEELLGYSREEIEGRGFQTFIPPQVLPAVKAEFRRLLDEGKPGTFENPVLTKSGELRTISWRNSPIVEDEKIVGTISFGIDVTEHRKTEAQLLHAQKMEAIGTLAGGIAHDFNNILTAIVGFGSLLLMDLAEDDPNRDKMQKILTATDRATALIQGLLAYSRKEAVNLRAVDLNDVVTRFDHFLSKIIGEDIELKILPAGGPLPILADVGQIEQVLMNLAANARDAMPDGGSLLIRVEETLVDAGFVASHGYGQEGHYAMLTASDTGAGIDTVKLGHIFEPFFTTKEVGKGTGLGLAIVYGIIKQHHGFINVYSEQGKGTTFRVYLPLTGLPSEERSYEMAPLPRGNGETILLAEDNEDIRNFFHDLLTGNGYLVMEAVDGVEAVEQFRQHGDEIQLFLLDVIMPRKNGKEAIDEIRAVKPDAKALFMSGYTADIISRKGILTEGLELISKPFSPHALLAKIREVLNEPVESR